MSRLAKSHRILLGVMMMLLVTLLNTIVFTTNLASAEDTALPAKMEVIQTSTNNKLVLKEDGTVWAWGGNSYGQLGNGTFSGSISPTQVSGLTNVISIASAGYHVLAIKSDGTVWAWGRNSFGQLGDGTLTNRSTPVQVTGLTDVVSVSVGTEQSFAVKSDGTVWAWGYNWGGQLGDGSLTDQMIPVQVPGLTDVTSTVSAHDFSFAIKSDGTIWAWGVNTYGQLGDGTKTNRATPVQVIGLTDVISLKNIHTKSVALKSDGTVWTWGSTLIPVQVEGLIGVSSISSSGGHTLALKPDGTVWAWGDNSYGQLGDGTTTNRTTPVQVSGLTNVLSVSSEGSSSLALKSDGTLWTWGANSSGQLGDNSQSNRKTPVQSTAPNKGVAVWGGGQSSIVLQADGTFWGAGYDVYWALSYDKVFVQLPLFGKVTLTATASSSTTVDLAYGANVPVSTFRVKRGTEVLSCPQSGANLTCQDRGVTSGVSYTYTVEAYDTRGILINRMSQTVTPGDVLTPKVTVTADKTIVSAGTTFAAKLYVEQAEDLFAEDVTISYDPMLFTFVKAEPASTGLKIYHQSETMPGTVRVVVASQGTQFGLNGTAHLLNLTLRANDAAGKGTIAITRGLVANSKGEEIEPTLSSTEITVIQTNADVNGDGRVSLGDLAIAGYHFGMDKSLWTYPKADLDGNDNVNDIDLSKIVETIFNSGMQ